MSDLPRQPACNCGPEGCKDLASLDRRELLGIAGIAAAYSALGGARVMAGPFEENDYRHTIPADKKLDPAWVRSLYERGEKETYSDPAALARIGMPVGGLFAGTVYLSGDGRLWLWDVFNRDQEGILPREINPPANSMVGDFVRGGANFVQPAPLTQPFEQGFELEIAGRTRTLDSSGFAQVTFDGRYPIGRVAFRDPSCPLTVDLEAFSPFIPLAADDSSLPATVMSYKVTNPSAAPVAARISGRMANPICLESRSAIAGERRNRVIRQTTFTAVEFSAKPAQTAAPNVRRPDIRFDDFEAMTYDGWTVEGDAFGAGPILAAEVPDYQNALGAHGNRLVNSHATAPGDGVAAKDGRTGILASKPFTIERRYIAMLVGGGRHPDQTCVNLLVDGKKVASLTGQNENAMRRRWLAVAQYEGKQARLEIVDAATGAWGNIGVDDIIFTDEPPEPGDLAAQRDFGGMALALLTGVAHVDATARRGESTDDASSSMADDGLVGVLGQSFTLAPGESTTIDFVVAWHFPNLHARGCGGARVGQHYATLHKSVLAVVEYLAAHFERLAGATRRWVETWYDSTLPYWFLDRTMANTSVLATTTCYRFADGRFWAWEGVGCCEGTCTHVWHYAQALGRLFPEVERIVRADVDFGLAMHEDGGIGHRASLDDSMFPADDGQCGRILGAYREHLTSTDGAFLRRIWPQVKRALRFLIRKDGNADGMIEDAQPNTLDAAWHGKISFLASLYLAALRAGEAMAREMDDDPFANQCREIADRGARSILATYDGEYFAHIEDSTHKQEIGIGPGCYIDQVFGQTWAHWVGLKRLFDRDKQHSALRALWKYNFVPDLGPFREKFPRGRWYAMTGDAGLIMCSWPKGGQNPAFKDHWQYMYFNECMTGFEWQAAAHMIYEGVDQPDLLEHGLAVARAIHDRYNAALRNPYNEIECSDHYARSMASYGAFQAICGFHCHGPHGHFEYAPRLTQERFRAAFVGPSGWGTITQEATDGGIRATLAVRHGELLVNSIGIRTARPVRHATVDGTAASVETRDALAIVLLAERKTVLAGRDVVVELL